MIQYAEDNDVAVADGLTFRRDKRTGYFLSGAPINGKRKRLHVYIWEKENGPVPNGFNVHHVDEDKMNNDISNLKLLSVHEHQHLHSKERFAKNPEWEKRFIEQGQKCAKKWHGSEAGHEWHKLHFQKNKDALFREREVICEYCGKKFIAHIGKKHHFCSGNCKSAYRRKMGYDNETRKCIICGKEYVCIKYSKGRTCSKECSGKLRHLRKNKADS